MSVPRHEQSKLAHLRIAPFSFENEPGLRRPGVFHIGEQAITAANMAEGVSFTRALSPRTSTNEEVGAITSSHAAVYGGGQVITLPGYHQFVQAHSEGEKFQELVDETVEVMRGVFEGFLPQHKGRTDYGVDLNTEIDGDEVDSLTFRVPGPGSGAQLSPDWHGPNLGYASHQYDVVSNNIRGADLPAQRIALLAGIGHVATRATRAIQA